MKSFDNEITDPLFLKPDKYNLIDRSILKYIRDERDLPFVYFIFKIIFFLIPFAAILYTNVLSGWQWVIAALVYISVVIIFFLGKFALMFHCTAHRTLFKKEFDYLNYFLPWLMAPFFGHMADTYYSHHVGMHHAENNLEDDESSTMPYQRDSFRDFLSYWGRFMMSGIYTLVSYFKKRNRKKLMNSAWQGEVLFIVFSVLMCLINWQATACVFIFPYFFYRFVAMMGNWVQHAFIDQEEPSNSYKNSITCINSKYNWQCWNDGYHVVHHLKQTMHWTEHPAHFLKTVDKYALNNAVVFSKLDYVAVWLFLMFKRYDLLAKNFVNIGDRFSSDEEVIFFLKERLQPFVFHGQDAEAVMA